MTVRELMVRKYKFALDQLDEFLRFRIEEILSDNGLSPSEFLIEQVFKQAKFEQLLELDADEVLSWEVEVIDDAIGEALETLGLLENEDSFQEWLFWWQNRRIGR